MPSPAPGGPSGDAYVMIRTLPDPLFVREGANLWHILHIGIPDGRGRLNVTVIVDVPQRLSPRQRRLCEHFRAEDGRAAGTSGLSA